MDLLTPIRPAIDVRAFDAGTPHDIAAVTAIYEHHVLFGKASYETKAPTIAEMSNRFAVLQNKGFPVLVAVEAGVVVGYAYAGPHKPRNGYRYTVEDSVYIAPDKIRLGIGKLLLTAVIAEAKRLGYRQMMAVIGGPAEESIALHRSLGFREIGVAYELGYKFGEWLDTVYMQLALQPDAKK